ncbi:hypothetical protein [Streptomyces sp. CJ_13]|uniref:hypothetical protein n=1 Tax=Streptomyces sp. CJ_13 TaxID=2724943 RepID=UPI00202A1F14|nr:hypothetical protein [Streptomyces sp. CJ_13]
METMAPTIRAQQYWYLVTLGRDALLRELAPLKLPDFVTRDPLTLAGRCLAADPIGFPEAHQAAERALAPLRGARTFTATVTEEDTTMVHTGVVPVLGEREAGGITGWYAELLLFEHGTLLNKAAYRLSRMPGDRTWIVDSDFEPSGHPGRLQTFGSGRLGRKRTLLPPFVAELDRLITQGPGGAT